VHEWSVSAHGLYLPASKFGDVHWRVPLCTQQLARSLTLT